MAITVNRKEREIRSQGVITFDVTGADVGKTYDFMGIAPGFRIIDANVTVHEAFDNDDNTIEVGIEEDTARFVPSTAVDAVKGVGFSDKQFTAAQSMSVIADIKGTASTGGKATVTVVYAKLPEARQEY